MARRPTDTSNPRGFSYHHAQHPLAAAVAPPAARGSSGSSGSSSSAQQGQEEGDQEAGWGTVVWLTLSSDDSSAPDTKVPGTLIELTTVVAQQTCQS